MPKNLKNRAQSTDRAASPWPFTAQMIGALGSMLGTSDGKILVELVERAEKSYDDMYDLENDTSMCYVSAREDLTDAAILAGQMGRKDLEQSLLARLGHIKSVYGAQFAPS